MADSRKEIEKDEKGRPLCPHCNEPMSKWRPPPLTSWGDYPQYVCFNDDCPYYVNGWKWMMDQYNKEASYRHRYNPFDGSSGPVPVWNAQALRARIIEDGETLEDFYRRTGRLPGGGT